VPIFVLTHHPPSVTPKQDEHLTFTLQFLEPNRPATATTSSGPLPFRQLASGGWAVNGKYPAHAAVAVGPNPDYIFSASLQVLSPADIQRGKHGKFCRLRIWLSAE